MISRPTDRSRRDYTLRVTLSLAFMAAVCPIPLLAAEPSPSPSQVGVPTASAAEPMSTPVGPVSSQILVPRGTAIVVTTNRGINSYGDQTGSKVTYTVVQDVIIDGHVIIKAGDIAEGAVGNSQAGRDDLFSQKAANLRISVDRVYNFCGDTVITDFVRSEYRRRQGVLGSHKDVEIIKGQMYQVLTERPQRICAEVTSAQSLPIPTGALLGDTK